MFEFDFTDQLKSMIRKLQKKYPKRAEMISRKVDEIISKTPQTINSYKNLRYDLKHLKRVHVDRHFVLVFKVEGDFILFLDFEHHDKVYRKY